MKYIYLRVPFPKFNEYMYIQSQTFKIQDSVATTNLWTFSEISSNLKKKKRFKRKCFCRRWNFVSTATGFFLCVCGVMWCGG